MENSGGVTTYEKLDGLARWVGTSVASAFFASLERCACVNLTTYDTDDEDEEEAKDRPLMLTNLPSFNTDPSVNNKNTNTHAASVDTLPV